MEAVPAFRLKYLKQSASVVSSEETYPYGLSLYTDSFPVGRQTRPKKMDRDRGLCVMANLSFKAGGISRSSFDFSNS